MKRFSLIAALMALMIMISSALCFAEGGLELVSSYPEDGQKDTSMENLGVKLTFNNPINSKELEASNKSKFTMVDEDGESVPVEVLFSDKDDGLVLVLADVDKGFTAKNNALYTLTINAGLTDNAGNTLSQSREISFRTYNQKANTIINMAMMFVMMGGIMFLTMRQNLKNEEESPREEPGEAAFNPYKEAKRTGKSVEEVKAEQARKEAKQARKKSKKSTKGDEDRQDKKIDNCAELLNNVYHVHAPAPTNKADRSIEAVRAANRRSAGKGKKK